MAKKSKIARQQQREEIVARYAARRRELKRTIRLAGVEGSGVTPEEGAEAVRALAALPRDSSPTRLRKRDVVDGRPRGHLGTFGLSRVRFREMALRGELPGVTKSSW